MLIKSWLMFLPIMSSGVLMYYIIFKRWFTGTDPGFQVRGAHLKKLRRAEGGAKNFGVFRVKNHIFSNFRGSAHRPLFSSLTVIYRTNIKHMTTSVSRGLKFKTAYDSSFYIQRYYLSYMWGLTFYHLR